MLRSPSVEPPLSLQLWRDRRAPLWRRSDRFSPSSPRFSPPPPPVFPPRPLEIARVSPAHEMNQSCRCSRLWGGTPHLKPSRRHEREISCRDMLSGVEGDGRSRVAEGGKPPPPKGCQSFSGEIHFWSSSDKGMPGMESALAADFGSTFSLVCLVDPPPIGCFSPPWLPPFTITM